MRFADDKTEILDNKENDERRHIAERERFAAFDALDIDDTVNQQIGGDRGRQHFYIHGRRGLVVPQRNGPQETSDHGPAPVEGEEGFSLDFRQADDLFRIVDEQAADAHFGADVHENRDHSQHKMRVAERADAPFDLFVALELRQMGELDQHRQEQEHPGKNKIRQLHAERGHRQTGVREDRLAGCVEQRGADLSEEMEHQIAADDGRDRGPERVERLRKVEPARRGFRLAEKRDVRICRDLEQRETDAEDEQHGKEQAVFFYRGGRVKTGAGDGGNNEPPDNAVLIPHLAHGVAPNHRDDEVDYRADEIGAEKGELNEHGLEPVQLEYFFQERDEDIIQYRDEAPHEKQRGDDDECGAVVPPFSSFATTTVLEDAEETAMIAPFHFTFN